jgi:hypothetical protein
MSRTKPKYYAKYDFATGRWCVFARDGGRSIIAEFCCNSEIARVGAEAAAKALNRAEELTNA